MRKEIRLFNALETAGFSVYFLLLFCERLAALILSVKQGGDYALTSGNPFNYVAYSVTAASLVAGTVLFVRLFVGLFGALRAKETYDFAAHSRDWTIASTVLLFGGMMHTGFTLAGLQFAAYGFLIAAMILRVVEACLQGEEKYDSVVSVVYLILFSMSIPVCYLSFAEPLLRGCFFAAEYVAVFALVPIFGVLLDKLMRTGKTSFSPIFPSVMAVLSGLTVALKWREEINMFVLIFAGLTLLCYLTLGLVALRREQKEKDDNL